MKDYFVKLPNNLFYSTKEDVNILEECGWDYKVILVVDYLYTNTNRKNITMLTLEDLILETGFKPDNHVGKINDKFRAILNKLQELNIILDNIDFKKIKPKELIKCQINLFVKDKNNNDINFIQLYDIEKNKILDFEEENIDNLKLLYYYCYLKSRMYKRQKKNDIYKSGGKAEVCYPSYKKIKEDINIKDGSIKKYNDILIELNLIRIGNAGLYYFVGDRNKTVRESNNIYTLWDVENTWKINLEEGIKFYKKKYADERVFTGNRIYKNNDKSINGYIARVEYLEQQGKAKEEQIQKKDDYKKSIDKDEDINKRIKFLEKKENKGLTFSEIFKNDKDKSKKALKLERELGLLDINNNLIVDYSYYKWVMVNYTSNKKDYLINCIKKHITEKEVIL